jgi:hypothetical protein
MGLGAFPHNNGRPCAAPGPIAFRMTPLLHGLRPQVASLPTPVPADVPTDAPVAADMDGVSRMAGTPPAASSGRHVGWRRAVQRLLGRVLRLATGVAVAVGVSLGALGAGPARAQSAAAFKGLAVVTIVEGDVHLVRQTTRYRLVEGVRLQPDDLVETPEHSFAQIEFGDGAVLEVAPGSRLMIQPRWVSRKAGPPVRGYLLAGWYKFTHPGTAAFELLAPKWSLVVDGPADGKPQGRSTVVLSVLSAAAGQPLALTAFIEAGEFRVTEREQAPRVWQLKADDFFVQRGEERSLLLRKPSPEFLAQMPVVFRDTLPPRANRFANREEPPPPQGDVQYAEMQPWMKGEWPLRQHLLQRLRGRAQDPGFRAGLVANLAEHPEWERVLFPERFQPHGNPASR